LEPCETLLAKKTQPKHIYTDVKKIFRRHIKLNSRTKGSRTVIRIALEDDIHHFRVQVSHKNNCVTEIEANSIRIPYSLCSNAAPELQKLIGQDLTSIAHSVHRMTDARLQCTHLLDMAGLAIAASRRGEEKLNYQIEVPRRILGKTTALLYRNKVRLLQWDMNFLVIESSPPFSGIDLKKGFAGWAIANLPLELSEAAIAFRRAVTISLGREQDLDKIETMKPTNFCYAQQTERVTQGKRVIGSTKDYTHIPNSLCEEDRDWLRFLED